MSRHSYKYFLESPPVGRRAAGGITTLFFRWLVPLLLCVCIAAPVSSFAASKKYALKGKGTWYGTTAHGKKTASGEVFSRDALTAAHKQVPFGTIIRVHNLKNGKHVLVKVNDRGPFGPGYIVDVSLRAANLLEMKEAGTVPVSIELVSNRQGEPLNPGNSFYVHLITEVTALKTRAMAASLEKRLKRPVHALVQPEEEGSTFALCIGPFDTFPEAHKEFLRLEDKSIQLLGIIEAPSDRKSIPVYEPPHLTQPTLSEK